MSDERHVPGRSAFREAVWRVGEGRVALQVRVQDTRDGLVVTVLGDLGPHVGGIASAPPLTACSFPGHRDGELAAPIAEGLALLSQRPVVVVAGVHVDDVSREEIAEVLSLAPIVVDDVWEWVASCAEQHPCSR